MSKTSTCHGQAAVVAALVALAVYGGMAVWTWWWTVRERAVQVELLVRRALPDAGSDVAIDVTVDNRTDSACGWVSGGHSATPWMRPIHFVVVGTGTVRFDRDAPGPAQPLHGDAHCLAP